MSISIPSLIRFFREYTGQGAIPAGYVVEQTWSQARPGFVEACEQYSKLALDDFKPRGKLDHFRRIGPPHWPRTLHYEFLDYGQQVGTEIHLEGKEVEHLRTHMRSLKNCISSAFPGRSVEWDGLMESEHRACSRPVLGIRVIIRDSERDETADRSNFQLN